MEKDQEKQNQKPLTRRRFLQMAASLAGAAATFLAVGQRIPGRVLTTLSGLSLPAFFADARTLGKLVGLNGQEVRSAPPPQRTAPERRKWVMVIDLARCDGCGKCTEACTAMHRVPFGQEWIKVYQLEHRLHGARYWFPRPCMQCDNPPCVAVCPVDATFKREDGIVLIDQERCIGCRYCMAACPYSARYFNWGEPLQTAEQLAQPYSMEWNMPHRKGVVEKCIFCPALLREGKLPACASGCPMGAIYFGDALEDAVTNSWGETVHLSQLLYERYPYRQLEELGTEPRVYYLPHREHIYPLSPSAEARGEKS